MGGIRETRDLIGRHGVRPTKSLGQNFLVDENVLAKIAATGGIGRGDLVIEVGPGLGALTRHLAVQAGRVVAVEIDRHLLQALGEALTGLENVEIVHADILECDLPALVRGWDGPVKVVANLPYYITTPVVMKFLEELPACTRMVFLVQKEVADRMAAGPGTKDYGALSVAVRYFADPKRVFTVPPACFLPPPEVESAVVRLDVRDRPPVELVDRRLFGAVVRAAFGQRRKTLHNALGSSGLVPGGRDALAGVLAELGLPPLIRGEALTMEHFAQLAHHIASMKS